MAKPREIVDTVLFLPAMALLAVGVFAAFWLIIKIGNAAVYAWFWVFRDLLRIPFPAALAITVIAAALTVYGLFYWVTERRQRKAGCRA